MIMGAKNVVYIVYNLQPHRPLENHSMKLALTHIRREELTPPQDCCPGVTVWATPRHATS